MDVRLDHARARPAPSGRWVAPAVDAVLAAALLGFGAWVVSHPELDADVPLSMALFVPLVAPLFLRRRAPVAAVAVYSAAVAVSALPTLDQFRCGIAVPVALVLLFSLASRRPTRVALAGLAPVLAALVLLCYTDPLLDGDVLGFALFAFPLCGFVWWAGWAARERDAAAAQLAARSRQLQRRREETARLAVEVERTRLASDLDLAAREGVREAVRLARAGEALPAGHPDALIAFARIERLGRAALDEMRGLLGVLRSDARATRAPRPTLAQLEALLEDVRAGGRVVDYAVEGARRPLPGGVELAAYRVVQHALAAIGAAAGQPATITLRYLPEALEVEVGGLAAASGGADAAVAAARQRVAAHGGQFSLDRQRAGRRILRARLPLVATSA